MTYVANQNAGGLDTLDNTSIATGDLGIVGDVSDSNRAKAITIGNLDTYLSQTTKTLTNKTLTSPVVNTPTGIVKGDVGLGNVDNTSDATKNSATATLTNKRITKRVLALSAGSATPAINTDSYDVVHITAQSAAITSFTSSLTGTPVDGDTLRISITDNGTARALSFGASFEASTVALPTTTVISTRLDLGFLWNTETTKWRLVASA